MALVCWEDELVAGRHQGKKKAVKHMTHVRDQEQTGELGQSTTSGTAGDHFSCGTFRVGRYIDVKNVSIFGLNISGYDFWPITPSPRYAQLSTSLFSS